SRWNSGSIQQLPRSLYKKQHLDTRFSIALSLAGADFLRYNSSARISKSHAMSNTFGKGAGFWAGLQKPVLALAPMADVTDAAFRLMFARYGKPDVMFTEFVSVDGLCSKGRSNV